MGITLNVSASLTILSISSLERRPFSFVIVILFPFPAHYHMSIMSWPTYLQRFVILVLDCWSLSNLYEKIRPMRPHKSKELRLELRPKSIFFIYNFRENVFWWTVCLPWIRTLEIVQDPVYTGCNKNRSETYSFFSLFFQLASLHVWEWHRVHINVCLEYRTKKKILSTSTYFKEDLTHFIL